MVNANNPMELDWTKNFPQIGAIILAPGTGSNAMEALGKIMDGEVNPSGRTIETYLYDLTTSPSYNNSGAFNFDNVQQYQADNTAADPAYQGTLSFVNYVEDIYVGYKFYETAYAEAQDGNMDFDYDTNVQFPFGHGLSYTTFTQKITGFAHNETSVSVDVTVTNTGSVAGKDVVELYFTPPYSYGGIERQQSISSTSARPSFWSRAPLRWFTSMCRWRIWRRCVIWRSRRAATARCMPSRFRRKI